MTDRARLFADHLRHRRELGEREIFCEPGRRGVILNRAKLLAIRPGDAAATPGVDAARLAREGTAAEILAIPDIGQLKVVADACTRCGLHATRTHPVFADGSAEARVLCVGEAPGQREDETGVPFVGRAGQLLDRLLASVGVGREGVFICNVLKCRPPGNRNPLPEEIESCSPFLLRQLALVDPDVVIAFGTFAARTLLDSSESLGKMRQRTHRYDGRPLVVTYHPAALLRNPGWIRSSWEDLQRVREILDGVDPRSAPGN